MDFGQSPRSVRRRVRDRFVGRPRPAYGPPCAVGPRVCGLAHKPLAVRIFPVRRQPRSIRGATPGRTDRVHQRHCGSARDGYLAVDRLQRDGVTPSRAGRLAGRGGVNRGDARIDPIARVVPAILISAVVVLLCAPERTRRAINLVVVGASVAFALPWTLAVYSTGGAAERLQLPAHGLLRAAAAAIILAALSAGLVRLALSALAERVGPERLRPTVRYLGRALTIVAIVCVGAGSILGAPAISSQYRSFTGLKVNPNASVRFIDASGFRYDLWRVAVREFRAHPLVGLGAGNYDVDYYRLRHNPEYVHQPHSIELQMAAELGLGGLVALLLFSGSVLWAGFARRGTLASQDRMIKIAALGMFTAWLVHTSVDWLYDIPGLAGTAMVAAALLVLPSMHQRGHLHRGRRAQAYLLVGLGAVAVLAASVGRQYAAARYARTGAGLVAHSPRKAIGKLQEAARLDPYSTSVLYSLASAYARLDDYPAARTALLLAVQREPHNYVPWALLGDLAVRRGDYRGAATQYGRALALNPRDPIVRRAVLSARTATDRLAR